MFQLQRSGALLKDYPKPKAGNGGSKVIGLNANLAQAECKQLIDIPLTLGSRPRQRGYKVASQDEAEG
jgi:hypothetical protein